MTIIFLQVYRNRQEMHLKSVNDEMYKNHMNILACLSFVWLQYIQRPMLKINFKQPLLFKINLKHDYLIEFFHTCCKNKVFFSKLFYIL